MASTRSSGSTGARRSKSRGLKVFVGAVGVLAALVAVLVVVVAAFGLRIAAGVVKDQVAARSREMIQGSVEVGEVSLSWRGPQRIESLVLKDPQGSVIADLTIDATTGVVPLIFGSRDLGAVTISGEVAVSRGPGEQKTDLEQAIEFRAPPPGEAVEPPSPGGGPSTLPIGLQGAVALENLKIRFDDQRADAPFARAEATVDAAAAFAVGQPLTLSARVDGAVDGRAMQLSAAANLDRLTDSQGRITVEDVTGQASLAGSAPSGFIASLPGLAQWLEGSTLTEKPDEPARIEANFQGDRSGGEATLRASAPGFEADIAATITGDQDPTLRLPRPAVVSATLTPAMLANLQGEAPTATIAEPVRIGMRIDAFSMRLPQDGALDLRGAEIRATLDRSAVRGTIALPGEETPADFSLTPALATIEAPDLAGPVSVRASADATLRGQPAGTLALDATLDGLLDDAGAPKPVPARVQGEAALRGFALALAQSFVQDSGLVLTQDIGPALDATINADTTLAEGGASTTRISLNARAANLEASGEIQTDGKQVQTTGDGIAATLRDVTPTLARMLGEGGVSVQAGQPVTMRVRNLLVDLPQDGAPMRLDRASLDAEVSGGAVTLALQGREPVRLGSFRAGAVLAPDEAPKVSLSARGEGRPFTVDGAFAIEDLFDSAGQVQAANARPVGSLTASNVPVDLAALAGVSPEDVAMARSAIGDTLQARVQTSRSGADLAFDATVDADRARVTAKGAASRDAISLAEASASATVTPETVDAAMVRYARDLQPRPGFDRPLDVQATVEPIRVPIRDGKADLAAAGPVKATVRTGGDVVIQRAWTLDGEPLDAGIRGLQAAATWSLAEGGERSASVRTTLFEPSSPGTALGEVRGAVSLPSGPDDPLEFEGAVEQLDTARADALLKKPGLLEWSLGPKATVRASIKPTGAWPPEKGAGAQSGVLLVEAGVSADALTTSLAARVEGDRIALVRPMETQWTMDPRWASAYVTPPVDGQPPSVTFAAPTPLTLRVDELTLAKGEGPLLPGVFGLKASASAPSVSLRASDGRDIRLDGVQASVQGGGAPVEMRFDLSTRAASGGQGGARAQAMGTVSGIADAQGRPTPDTATITATATGEAPTALVDALARQGGKLAVLLGPTVVLDAKAQNLSRTTGSLEARLNAPRADASIAGDVQGGLFVSTRPVTARILEITPELSALYIDKSFPLIAKVEKRKEDGPATVTVTNLRAPIEPTIDTDGDGEPDKTDLRRLNADMRIELGAARYQTNTLFGQVLKATNNDASGKLFNNFPPLDVTVRDGVATYPRTKFPIGEFIVETQGTVDLAANTMDLVVYVPLAALVTEVAGVFQKVPGLGAVQLMPLRMKGPIGQAKPQPAPDLLLDNLVREAPTRVLEEGVGGLLDKVFGGDKNKKDGGSPN